MADIDKIIKEIRPSLRKVSPLTYYFTIGFGLFNVLVGLGLYQLNVLVKLKVVGIIPVRYWGIIFLIVGLLTLYFILTNNWKVSRNLTLIGVTIKSAWWLELFVTFLVNHSPFLLFIWSLLLYFQILVYIYFTPRVKQNELGR